MVLWGIEVVRESAFPIILKQHHFGFAHLFPRISSCPIPPIQFLSPLHSLSAGLKFRSFMMKLGEPGYGTLQEMQDALKALDECLSRIHIITSTYTNGPQGDPPKRVSKLLLMFFGALRLPYYLGLVKSPWIFDFRCSFSLTWHLATITLSWCRMSSGPNAIAVAVFIDEAEQVFSSRRSMQDYHSVRVEAPKKWNCGFDGLTIWRFTCGFVINWGLNAWHFFQTCGCLCLWCFSRRTTSSRPFWNGRRACRADHVMPNRSLLWPGRSIFYHVALWL